MQVENLEMFHFHTKNFHDDLWKKGNVIEIDENYKSDFITGYERCSTYYFRNKERYELFDTLYYNIDRLNNPEFIEELINMSKEDAKEYAEDLQRYISTVDRIFRGYLIRDREYLLESVRQKYYPDLPSRYNSIWVCDEKSKDFWSTQLHDDKVLYNVSLTGNLFKSSDEFIPDYRQELFAMEELAHRYWNPKFETEEQEKKAEYLFQGNVKILKRINKRSTR